MYDPLPYTASGLTVNAIYSQGNQVWNTNSSAYEAWRDDHYKLGYYSVSAPQDGGGIVTLSGVVLNSTTSVTVASTASLTVGMSVSGTGIPAGATIASISNGTVFILSAGATSSVASGTYTAGNNSCRYTASAPSGVVTAGHYDVEFRQYVDGTAANDTVIGGGSSDSAVMLAFIGGRTSYLDNGDGTFTLTFLNSAGANVVAVTANKTTGQRTLTTWY